MIDVVYYTCLNNDCEKHRNVFVEGSPEHAECARERLYLEGQRKPAPSWLWYALPLAIAAGAAAFVLFLRARSTQPDEPRSALREETPRQTWSGSHIHADERAGHAVPPPIV